MNKLPKWSAPILGPLLGGIVAYFTLRDSPLSEQVGIITFTAVGAGTGLLAGIIVWLMDRRKAD